MINTDLPLVSVVFTSYNHHDFLRQALDSIVNQTYSNVEIIVIDDNSTDGSKEILKTYESNPKIFLHLLDKNTGSYVKASNYGAKFANGEYLLFAQCDDYADPTQIEKLVKGFDKGSNIGVVYSKSNLVDESDKFICDDFSGREKSFRKKCTNDTVITGAEMKDFLAFSCVIPNLSAALIKKELYFKSGGLSEKFIMAADWALWLELTEFTDFYYITETLNNFRQHSNTIRSKTKVRTQIKEIYALFYHHIDSNKLTSAQKTKIKIGTGGVWFSYIIEDPKSWFVNFPAVFSDSFKFEKFNLGYLFLGALKLTKEFVYK